MTKSFKRGTLGIFVTMRDFEQIRHFPIFKKKIGIHPKNLFWGFTLATQIFIL